MKLLTNYFLIPNVQIKRPEVRGSLYGALYQEQLQHMRDD